MNFFCTLISHRLPRSVTCLLIALITVFSTGYSAAANEPQAKKKPAPMVEIETVILQNLEQRLPLTGEVIAIESAKIAANVDGPIASAPFRPSDKVAAGDILIVIERETLRAEVTMAKAALEVARARYADQVAGTRQEEIDKASELVKQYKESADFASKDLERITRLVESGAMPSEELEKARVKHVSEQSKLTSAQKQLQMLKAGETNTRLAIQRAVVKEAEAKLELAQARLNECVIKAPFSGVVTKLWVSRGDMAAVKAPLLELTNFASLVVKCAVPEKHSGSLAVGMKADIRIDALPNKIFKATVTRIYPELDERMRTRKVELIVEEAAPLMPGMFARIELVLQSFADAISLPVQAFKNSPDGKTHVFLAAEGKAVTRPVEVGVIIGNRRQVLSGINQGDKVIVGGNEKLKDGAEIRIPGAGKAKDEKSAGNKN